MEFLVRIQLTIPPELAPEQRARLAEAEARRGRELQEAGTIVRIWRIPGRTANAGVWEAPDATALHEAIASLPMFPYLQADVTPLATHPLEAAS
ncbi:MAG TPA: muconolactone Delta-isomerase family protein [Conexibacter sp.]|nr:muconolactone Delta-isomerase family protein [Conexibacter sp.]